MASATRGVEEQYQDVLEDQPEGYVEHLGGQRYLVRGKTGTYCCWAAEGRCDCPDHVYRHVPGSDCRHLKRLREWFDEQGLVLCETCEGSGCKACDHQGVMSPSQKDEGKEAADTMSDEELRALFA